GRKETRRNKNDDQRAERHWVAQGQARRRPTRLELTRRHQGTLDVCLPERLRDGILIIGGKTVCNRRRRPVRFTGAAVKSAETVADAGQPQNQQRQRCRHDGNQKYEKPDGARKRRQYQPKTRPRESQEESDHCRHCGKHWPKPFPQDAAARAPERSREQKPYRLLPIVRLVGHTVQKSTPSPGLRRIYLTRLTRTDLRGHASIQCT